MCKQKGLEEILDLKLFEGAAPEMIYWSEGDKLARAAETFEVGLKPVQTYLTDPLDGIYSRACAWCEVHIAFM